MHVLCIKTFEKENQIYVIRLYIILRNIYFKYYF